MTVLVKPPNSDVFFVENISTIDSVYLMNVGLFIFFISFESVLVNCVFLENHSFIF